MINRGTAPPRVALKFLRHHEHFKAEINARQCIAAAKNAFLPLLADYSADTNCAFHAELEVRKLDSYRYMLVMEAGDRDLDDTIVHEYNLATWPDDAKRACKEVAEALVALHSAGFVHGDVKPRNIVRVGAHFKLIDFDSAVAIGALQLGKLSTAFAPPEAFNIEDGNPKVDRNTNLEASVTADAWSFGVTLYRALRNSTLVRVQDNDAAAGESELLTIAKWSDATKASLLADVPDVVARNLLSQLLHKDPAKRLSLDRALKHPFFTGNILYTRLVGEAPVYDVFLSYRVDSDAFHVKMLYESFTERGLRVFWDDPSLPGGKNWEKGFCSGLMNSATFVCLLSREAINSSTVDKRNIAKLTANSGCDNVVLEWRLAQELSDMGMMDGIFPVMIGDKDPATSLYSDYFLSGCHPGLIDDVVVASIESKVNEHLEREGLGCPLTPNLGVRSKICSMHGQKVGSNDTQKPESDIDRAVEKIVRMVSAAKGRYEMNRAVVNASQQLSPQSEPSATSAHASSAEAITWVRVVDPDGTIKFVSSCGETIVLGSGLGFFTNFCLIIALCAVCQACSIYLTG